VRKHGIDFVDAEPIFRGFILTAEGTHAACGERRFLAPGFCKISPSRFCTPSATPFNSQGQEHEARFYLS
jgi:hypothetical protein